MKTSMVLGAFFALSLPLLCSAQIVQPDLSTAQNWHASTVQSPPFEANATFINPTGAGNVSITTGGYFSGQSHSNRGAITSGGSSLALDSAPPSSPYVDGWNWVSRFYAVGFPDYIHGPEVLSDYFKAGEGVSFLFSEMVAGFSIDVTFAPLTYSAAAPGAYRVFAFGDGGALLGSISSTHTSSNYLDISTWENLSLHTSDFSDAIRGITVIREEGDGVFINSASIRLASAGDMLGAAPVPEPAAFLPAGIAVLGFLIVRRLRKR